MPGELIQFHQPFSQSFKEDLQLLGAAGFEITDLSSMAAFLLAARIEQDNEVHRRRLFQDKEYPALVTNSTLSILRSMSIDELTALRKRLERPPF